MKMSNNQTKKLQKLDLYYLVLKLEYVIFGIRLKKIPIIPGFWKLDPRKISSQTLRLKATSD